VTETTGVPGNTGGPRDGSEGASEPSRDRRSSRLEPSTELPDRWSGPFIWGLTPNDEPDPLLGGAGSVGAGAAEKGSASARPASAGPASTGSANTGSANTDDGREAAADREVATDRVADRTASPASFVPPERPEASEPRWSPERSLSHEPSEASEPSQPDDGAASARARREDPGAVVLPWVRSRSTSEADRDRLGDEGGLFGGPAPVGGHVPVEGRSSTGEEGSRSSLFDRITTAAPAGDETVAMPQAGVASASGPASQGVAASRDGAARPQGTRTDDVWSGAVGQTRDRANIGRSAGDGSGGGLSPSARRTLFMGIGVVIVVLFLVGMFLLGRAVAHPSDVGTPTPTPTVSATHTP
jgi:hypothetical protein